MEPEAPPSPPRRVKLNVGGTLFETTTATLSAGGPSSLLSSLSASAATSYPSPLFLDRDPDLFSALLHLLRSRRLPSSSRSSLPLLSSEALYYGLPSSLLRSAVAPPPLSGVAASLSATLLPSSSPVPSALSAAPDGSLWLAHAGQISAYDDSLLHSTTLRTHLDHITSLRRASTDLAAVGSSSDAPGLHLYHLPTSHRVAAVHWTDPADPRIYKARVTAIAALPSLPAVFAAFECPHRENAILTIDKETLKPVSELGRQTGGSTKTTVPGKLTVLPDRNLLFASAVSVGAFGYSGYMRLWDPRTREAVWETTEPGAGRSSRFGDSFADAEVEVELGKIYKVCWRSGDVGVADVRMLGEDPWEYLEEKGVASVAKGGEGSVVCPYQGQVYVSREGDVEVWVEVDDGEGGQVWRRLYVGGEEEKGRVRWMEVGGERLFVGREGVEGVEVWESSDLSGAVYL